MKYNRIICNFVITIRAIYHAIIVRCGVEAQNLTSRSVFFRNVHGCFWQWKYIKDKDIWGQFNYFFVTLTSAVTTCCTILRGNYRISKVLKVMYSNIEKYTALVFLRNLRHFFFPLYFDLSNVIRFLKQASFISRLIMFSRNKINMIVVWFTIIIRLIFP